MHSAGEQHPHPTLLSDFILGSQDGLVNVLGILLGLVAASLTPGSHVTSEIVIIAGLSALGAESLSMGAVAYTSTYSRMQLYRSEREREIREMREVPELEREEVRTILRDWGYAGDELEEMLRRIEAKPKAWLDLMMAFELNLSYVPPEAPRRSAVLVGFATVLGHFVPLVPFFFSELSLVQSAIVATVLSAIMLFGIGLYEARVTAGSIWRSGLRITVIGLASGLAGLLIGHFAALL
ncbi:MAG TPA: VIT1/CCC1 transporter family protein [Thermoplasmata archaeon]|jgi:VIT1/CCC1 family predicted Fe2+/Mn2+ transporter|nr:VIT1/CCC1 transporter family protein [Thermoplasmata archaeon]